MQTANAMVQIRMAETFAHIISEHAGILCASAIFSFGSVACEPTRPSPSMTTALDSIVSQTRGETRGFVGMQRSEA